MPAPRLLLATFVITACGKSSAPAPAPPPPAGSAGPAGSATSVATVHHVYKLSQHVGRSTTYVTTFGIDVPAAWHERLEKDGQPTFLDAHDDPTMLISQFTPMGNTTDERLASAIRSMFFDGSAADVTRKEKGTRRVWAVLNGPKELHAALLTVVADDVPVALVCDARIAFQDAANVGSFEKICDTMQVTGSETHDDKPPAAGSDDKPHEVQIVPKKLQVKDIIQPVKIDKQK